MGGLTGLPFMKRKSSWYLENWQGLKCKGDDRWSCDVEKSFPSISRGLAATIHPVSMETLLAGDEASFFCRLYQCFGPSDTLGLMGTHAWHRCGSASNKLWGHQWTKQNSAMCFIYLKITWATFKVFIDLVCFIFLNDVDHFKVFTEFVIILLYFMFLFCFVFFWLWGMWELSSLTRDWTHIPALEGEILTTESPGKSHSVCFSCYWNHCW